MPVSSFLDNVHLLCTQEIEDDAANNFLETFKRDHLTWEGSSLVRIACLQSLSLLFNRKWCGLFKFSCYWDFMTQTCKWFYVNSNRGKANYSQSLTIVAASNSFVSFHSILVSWIKQLNVKIHKFFSHACWKLHLFKTNLQQLCWRLRYCNAIWILFFINLMMSCLFRCEI